MDQDRKTMIDAIAAGLMARLDIPGPDKGPGPFGPEGPGGQRPALPPGLEQLPDLFPRTRLAIQGMELTQATQHYGTGHGDQNGVPLVALKPLVARVYPYVRQGLFADDALSGQAVTGELVVYRNGREVYRTGPTRTAGSRVGAAGSLDRTLLDREMTVHASTGGPIPVLTRIEYNSPLNFVVPGWYLRAGRTTFAARLWLVSIGSAGTSASVSETLPVHDVGSPRIALVRVNWRDAAGNVSAPSDADMLATMRLAERMMPFPYLDPTILGVEYDKSGNFGAQAMGGGCNAQWVDLLDDLEETRVWTRLFGLADIVYGLLPAAAVPAAGGPINTGCGRGNTAVGGSFVLDSQTFAHEIGHIYRRAHVAVAGDTSSDPDYPNYGGDVRSIGEVGVDVSSPTIALHDPASVDDVMSYGAANWISPYTYRGIFNARDAHRAAIADPERVRPFLIVSLVFRRFADGERKVEVKKAHRVDAPGSYLKPTAAPPFAWLDLADREDRIIAVHPLRRERAMASCGCCPVDGSDEDEPTLRFVEVVEWPAEATSLHIRQGDKKLDVLQVGEAPSLELGRPEITEETVELSVRARHPRAAPSIVVLFTGDDGRTWMPVTDNAPERLRLDAMRLPGGAACRFKVIATAELSATMRETETFDLPRRGRRLFVTAEPSPCAPGEVSLRALVDTRGLGMPGAEQVSWRSDRDGELGLGVNFAVTLSPGRHALEATAPDGLGGTVSERAIIVVGGRPAG